MPSKAFDTLTDPLGAASRACSAIVDDTTLRQSAILEDFHFGVNDEGLVVAGSIGVGQHLLLNINITGTEWGRLGLPNTRTEIPLTIPRVGNTSPPPHVLRPHPSRIHRTT